MLLGSQTRLLSLEVALPYWDEAPSAWNDSTQINQVIVVDSTLVPDESGNRIDDYLAAITVKYTTGTETNEFTTGLGIKILSPDIANLSPPEHSTLLALIVDKIERLVPSYPEETTLIPAFLGNVAGFNKKIKSIRKYMNAFRPICEDFQDFKAYGFRKFRYRQSLNYPPMLM